MIKQTWSQRLTLFTSALLFCVILLGAYTRLTDAGLSCPDWPHCYGYVGAPHTQEQIQHAQQLFPETPVHTTKAWTEMIHRYVAGTAGLLVFFLALMFSTQYPYRSKTSRTISAILVALLGSQVMLGMLTVTEKLKPAIVLGHLLTGFALLSLLWWSHLTLGQPKSSYNRPSRSPLKPWLWLGLIVLALQITLGGWVSTHYAALACIDFPYCNGTLFPTLNLHLIDSDLITIHMLHRFGAYITAIVLFWVACKLMRQPAFKALGLILLILLSAQLTLGIAILLHLKPLHIALTHHATALLLLLTLITALAKATTSTTHRGSAL